MLPEILSGFVTNQMIAADQVKREDVERLRPRQSAKRWSCSLLNPQSQSLTYFRSIAFSAVTRFSASLSSARIIAMRFGCDE
jgi:hypothetical protein